MKNKILSAALFATTALTPVQADAAPVVAFAQGVAAAFGAFGAAGAAAGTALGGAAAAGVTVGTFLGQTFVGRLLVGIGLAALSTALRPRPKAPPAPERVVSVRQDIAPMQHVYGRVRTSGPIGFWQFNNSRRFYTVILSSSPVNGILAHILDDRAFTQLGTNTDTSGSVVPIETLDFESLVADGNTPPDTENYAPNVTEFTSGGTSRAQVSFYNGASGQTASTLLSNVFTQWTTAHDMADMSYAVVVAHRPQQNDFSTVYPNGREWNYAPLIEGKNTILDYRTNTRGYTRNAALVIADWITSPYGLGRQVDAQNVIEEANACDVMVTDREGNQRRKWVVNGIIYESEEKDRYRAELGVACDAFFFERPDGVVGFRVGRWIEPTITMRDNNFLSISLSDGSTGANNVNEQVVEYIEPERGWVQSPSGTFVFGDNSIPNRASTTAEWIDNHNQASRIAKRLIRSARARYRLAGTVNLSGYNLIGERFFRFINEELDIDQTFEVSTLTRNEDGISFSLEAFSVNESDFDFDSATEEPTRPLYDFVSDQDVTATPANLAFVSATTTGGVAAIQASWDAPSDDTLQTRIRYRVSDTMGVPNVNPAYLEFTEIEVATGETSVVLTGLLNNVEYELQAQHFTPLRRASAYTPDPAATVETVANPNAPAALVAFGAARQAPDIVVSFTAPNDANYASTRIYRQSNAGTPDFSQATLIREEFGPPNVADSYTDPSPTPGDPADTQFSYWGIPRNGSGVDGPTSGPSNVAV